MMLGGSTGWLKISPLDVLISRACDPSVQEPNYAVHLEVAEYINTKKANTPREAAMAIARLANHRNPHIAVLALALIDTLVQSCGYPFHLQISTKEFLNELVRRFPERPPPFPNPVMSRILELIHGWKEGICVESRWKDDLGNIRDMHRLLTYKGYRFRPLVRQPSLAAASNIKSAEELESEDREAQSAKLQELIRRGTPRDLAAAQELMKALAGADPDAKPDYRTQALTELNKLEQKVILMNEMLDNADSTRGEKFVAGDVYDQVASILTNARPKLQKWISDAETHDPESLDTFLQINDQINTVLNRYEAFKKGDFETSSNPIPAELSSGPSTKYDLSLIDFDASTSPKAIPSTSAQEELASLFGPSSSTAAPVPAVSATTVPQNFSNPMPGFSMGAGIGMTTPNQQMLSNMGATHPQMFAPQMPSMHPGMMGMGMGMGGMNMGMGMGIPANNAQSAMGTPGAQQFYASPIPSSNFGAGMGMGTGLATPPMNQFGTMPPAIQLSATPPLQPFGAIQLTDTTPRVPSAGPSVGGGVSGSGGMMVPQRPSQFPNQTSQPQQTSQQSKDPFADLVELL